MWQIQLENGILVNVEPYATPQAIFDQNVWPNEFKPLVALVDGQLWDLMRPLSTQPKVVAFRDATSPEGLQTLRHSAAHVMAEAITKLWPNAQLAYGPPTETGFYYDVALDTPISSDDFATIQKEMAKIIGQHRPFTRYELDTTVGLEKLEHEANKYKIDNANRAISGGDSMLSWYATGEPSKNWEDLCRGPHVPNTSYIGGFKVMSVAASHWHGDVNSDRFQRVYGTAFATKEELNAYLLQLEAAKARDHRVLGQKLGLFVIDEQVGPGLILWKPKGATLRMVLEDFLRQELVKRGYQMVYTPHIGKLDLYKTSGHFPYYSDSQFPPIQMAQEDGYLLKPMNCPHHIRIFESEKYSYRDLPIRLAEFGTVYRYEQSGELTGMTRVRGFTQDDAHIFCTQEQLREEFKATLQLIQYVFATFGFTDVLIRLSLRDRSSEKYVGSKEAWDHAEAELRQALDELGLAYQEAPGEAAFYGPKVDFIVRDVIGRRWQLGTVQLDYNLPERFELSYIDRDGQSHRPVMIHRAPFGSLERFIAILIEHFEGAFPFWLAPEQVRILPVSDKHAQYAEQLAKDLRDLRFRAHADTRSETLGKKIRDAQKQKLPVMLVVGDREVEQQTVSPRLRNGEEHPAMDWSSLQTFLQQQDLMSRATTPQH